MIMGPGSGLFVSIRQLQDGQIGVVLANQLHADGQTRRPEADGHTDSRQVGHCCWQNHLHPAVVRVHLLSIEREDSMKRKRHTPQEIIAKLREAEVDLNQGATIETVCRKLEISQQTFHRWRHLYGGIKGLEMARMKELEKENARLKKIYRLH